MSDLLLSAANSSNTFPQQTGLSDQLLNIVQNPTSIFTGFGENGGNAFGQFGDFSNEGESSKLLEQLNLIDPSANQTADKIKDSGEVKEGEETQEQAASQFPLPEEGKPKGDEPIEDKYKNSDGKTKSWQQIRDDSSVCKNFGGDAKDIEEIKKGAKEKFGDWENEKDPEKASRSYIKFRELLEYADNSKSSKGEDRGEEANNGNLNGLTNSGDIRDGTELSTVINYFRHGRQFVADTTEGGVLKKTQDKYVRGDGSTRSDAGQVFVDIGNGISHVIPGLGNAISGAADGIDRGAQKGDVGAAIAGGFKGGFNGAVYTAQNALGTIDITDPENIGSSAKNLFGGGFNETL